MNYISVLHPTARPVKALEIYDHWLQMAKFPDRCEYIFAYDDSNIQAEMNLSHHNHVKVPYSIGCVSKLNAAANIAKHDIFVGTADDVFACKNWDELIDEAIVDSSHPVVVACEDGFAKDPKHRPELLRCFVATKAWVNKRGYCLHPKFTHVFSDDFFTAQAVAENCIIKAPHILLEHRHPLLIGGELDEVYRNANTEASYRFGREVFEQLLLEHNLKPNTDPIL